MKIMTFKAFTLSSVSLCIFLLLALSFQNCGQFTAVNKTEFIGANRVFRNATQASPALENPAAYGSLSQTGIGSGAGGSLSGNGIGSGLIPGSAPGVSPATPPTTTATTPPTTTATTPPTTTATTPPTTTATTPPTTTATTPPTTTATTPPTTTATTPPTTTATTPPTTTATTPPTTTATTPPTTTTATPPTTTTATPPTTTATTPPTTTTAQNSATIGIITVCTEGRAVPRAIRRTTGNTTLLSTRTGLEIVLRDAATQATQCQFTSGTLRDQMVRSRQLDLALIATSCPNLGSGTYQLQVRGPGTNDNIAYRQFTVDVSRNSQNRVTVNPATTRNATVPQPMVFSGAMMTINQGNTRLEVYAGPSRSAGTNCDAIGSIPRDLMVASENEQQNTSTSTETSSTSDSQANTRIDNEGVAWTLRQGEDGEQWVRSRDLEDNGDPLVISLSSKGAQLVDMRSVSQGVWFDLLGLKSNPAPFAKKLTSWFTAASAATKYFVTLPNKFGQVNGANELFGNYTQGPDLDNQFAADGFEALRKWDGRFLNGGFDIAVRDGVIDNKDQVFSFLRFWSDRNADGVAQSSELRSAADLGLKSIDLNYDPRFYEKDQHGNIAMYKSVARTRDGRQHLVFDLWLRYRE